MQKPSKLNRPDDQELYIFMIREHTDSGTVVDIPLTFGPYTYLRTIGTGSSSVVVLVVNSQTGDQCACKVINRKTLTDERRMYQFSHSLDILQTHQDPRIVEFREVLYTPTNIFLVMEYCAGGELISLVSDFETLPRAARYRIFWQVLRGVSYLHDHGIAHRDLKPDNIMLDSFQNAKLTDFGLSRLVDGDSLMSTPCGSTVYVAPEIVLGREYDGLKADIWSLGVVLYVLETGCLPWTAASGVALFRQITTAAYVMPPSAPADIAWVIDACLQPDPDCRATAAELLRRCGGRRETSSGVVPRSRTTSVPKAGILYRASAARSAVYRQHLRRATLAEDGVAGLPCLHHPELGR
jgi:serine/threonine protein kinase